MEVNSILDQIAFDLNMVKSETTFIGIYLEKTYLQADNDAKIAFVFKAINEILANGLDRKG